MLGRDGIAGLVCLAGSLWLLALTAGLPQPALVPIGPGFYPRIVLAATALLSLLLVGTDVLARRRARRAPSRVAPAQARGRNYRLVVLTFAVFAVYVVALPLVGYRVATFLFTAAMQLALDAPGERHWVRAVLVALVTAVVTHLVFEHYLSVLLPRGRWTGI